MNNYMDYKYKMKYSSIAKTSTMKPLKFGNGYVISSNTVPGMWLPIHDGIKINPCQ